MKYAPYTISLSIAAVILFVGTVEAQRKKKKTLLDQDAVQCVDVSFGKKEKMQEVCCNEATPGVARARGDKVLFTTLKLKNRQARSQAKARGKKPPKKWKQLIRETKDLCPITEGGTPTPTPLPNQPLHWDFEGEVNAAGKECFQIPEQLSANVLSGESVWNEHCAGCHGGQTAQVNRKFPELRDLIAESPMFLTTEDVSDVDLAAITAYLNRFNPNECPE